jgi:DNA-binding transcriptional ArsR family regulator
VRWKVRRNSNHSSAQASADKSSKIIELAFWAFRLIMCGVKTVPRLTSAHLELSAILYALSDPSRMAIVRTLLKAQGRALTCGELLADRPKSSRSHHFRILREAGVIETSVEGKEHFNRLRTAEIEKRFPGVMKSVLAAIGQSHRK